ncbi:MAG: ABC transporter permease [Parcubacteria group bacterium]
MKLSDILEETTVALKRNKSRSGLTILGIVIGISSVITMVSIGNGAENSITSQIESIGSNLITVMPGALTTSGSRVSSGLGSADSLKMSDLEKLQSELKNVIGVTGVVTSRYQITAGGSNTNTSVVGTGAEYAVVRNVEMRYGDFISEQNVANYSKIAVLGPTTAKDLFGEDVNPVGETVKIRGTKFKVVGVTESKGSSGMLNQDDIIYVPLSTAQRILVGSENLSTIGIAAASANVMPAVQEKVTEILLKAHNIKDPDSADFTVMNQAELVDMVSDVMDTLTLLLAAIAGISLLVGGIGIMNMMLTTVTERTREIGLRKALGAKKGDINKQFLFESIVLTLLGGTIGVALGCVVSLIIGSSGIVPVKISLSSILLAFGVSAAIGITFGYYPARRAGALNPIEALRYE